VSGRGKGLISSRVLRGRVEGFGLGFVLGRRVDGSGRLVGDEGRRERDGVGRRRGSDGSWRLGDEGKKRKQAREVSSVATPSCISSPFENLAILTWIVNPAGRGSSTLRALSDRLFAGGSSLTTRGAFSSSSLAAFSF